MGIFRRVLTLLLHDMSGTGPNLNEGYHSTEGWALMILKGYVMIFHSCWFSEYLTTATLKPHLSPLYQFTLWPYFVQLIYCTLNVSVIDWKS